MAKEKLPFHSIPKKILTVLKNWLKVPNKCIIASALSFLLCFSIFAQENQNKKEEDLPQIIDEKAIEFKDDIDPLTPAKAAFLSAVLPGLGQAYNKKCMAP